jgi:hypothetical protein
LLDFQFTNETKCLLNVPIHFRLNERNKKYTLLFENVINMDINVYYLYLNKNQEKKSFHYENILNNMIEISNDSHANIKYVCIELNCNKTCDENIMFILKNIY